MTIHWQENRQTLYTPLSINIARIYMQCGTKSLTCKKPFICPPPPLFFDSPINIIFNNRIYRVWVFQFFKYILIRLCHFYPPPPLKKMIKLPKTIKCFLTKLKSQEIKHIYLRWRFLSLIQRSILLKIQNLQRSWHF